MQKTAGEEERREDGAVARQPIGRIARDEGERRFSLVARARARDERARLRASDRRADTASQYTNQ